MPKSRRVELDSQASAYSSQLADEAKFAYQLSEFNSIWRAALGTPFYAMWADRFSLPSQIVSLDELQDFPALRKSDLVEHFRLLDFTRGSGPYVSTGGSTGAPVKLPRSPLEAEDSFARAFLGKVAAGALPGDSYVHLWGHSFLFGTGRSRHLKLAKRRAKDWLAGGVRLSAYDYTDAAVQQQVSALVRKNPVYVIGYTSALVRLARVALETGDFTREALTNLKFVVVTAETATESDRQIIEEGLGAPCLVEYGCAEAGVLAHSEVGGGGLRTYWRSVILSADRLGHARVTTIAPRGFPLVNYDLNDRLGGAERSASLLKFDSVEGRAQDIFDISLSSGDVIAVGGRFLVHSAKTVPGVLTVQYSQRTDGIDVYVTLSGGARPEMVRAQIGSDLRSEFGQVEEGSVRVFQVSRPVPSKSGKLTLSVPPDVAQPLVV